MTSKASLDENFMRAALAFGRRFLGATGTNPAVGALVVKAGATIGRGATQAGGRPHAETQALAEAGGEARGSTLYVTLEPCSHYGLTAPCASAVAQAGVARVVSAMEDPDPRVSGRGHRMLGEAGIEVEIGVCSQAARRAHLGHIRRVLEGRPMVTLKLAQTADGFAAGEPQDPRLRITGAAADNRVHMLRSVHDAIMIGFGTLTADDPLLTIRLPGMESRRPLRIVLDSWARFPLRSRLAATARDWPTLVVVSEDAPEERIRALAAAGLLVEKAPSSSAGGLDLGAVLRSLAHRGLSRVLCEGGPTLASRLIQGGLADELLLLEAPKPLGSAGLPVLSRQAWAVLRRPDLWRPFEAGFSGLDRWRSFERID